MVRRTTTLAAAFVLIFAMLTMPGCGRGETPEAFFEDMIATMDDLADLFGSIENQETANAAARRIEREFLPRIERLEQRMKRLQENYSDDEVEEFTTDDFKQRGERSGQRFMTQVMRIQMDPRLKTSALDEAMVKLMDAMSNFDS